MPIFGQLVCGAAGSGKTSYCATLVDAKINYQTNFKVINLDPGAGDLPYEPYADIREIIDVVRIMDAKILGPNGALIYCFNYLADHLEWFDSFLNESGENYYLFDLPGQLELFTHTSSTQMIIKHLTTNFDARLCAVFMIDSQFATDTFKFISSSLNALSTMIFLELPHFSVFTKTDLLNLEQEQFLSKVLSCVSYDEYCEKSKDLMKINPCLTPYTRNCQYLEKKYPQLIESIASILENFDLVIFYKMSLKKSRMISKLLTRINLTIQYDEYRESKNLDIET